MFSVQSPVHVVFHGYLAALVAIISIAGMLCLPGFVPKPLVSSRHVSTRVRVDMFAREYYPRWVVQNPEAVCPDLLQVARAVDPAITEEELVDAWGNPLRSFCLPRSFQIWSLGEDGQFATADDISSTLPR